MKLLLSSCFPCDKLALGNVRNTKFSESGKSVKDTRSRMRMRSIGYPQERIIKGSEGKVRVVAIVVYLNRAGKQSS